MDVLFEQPDKRYLIAEDDDENGFIYDARQHVAWESRSIATLYARGYWEPFSGDGDSVLATLPPRTPDQRQLSSGAKALKYSDDQPRDSDGRFASGGGTTPDNYRDTWKPEMTPAEGKAWAKAAGTQYTATVVHMTAKDAVEGIRGHGFDIQTSGESTRVAHEAGAYFALDRNTASFYEYKGDRAVSAVVVLQNPLEMDWSHPENLDRNTDYGQAALEGSFREAALLAAGLDRNTQVYDANDNEYFASESPEDCTQALRDAGYDGVIIHAQSADTDPSTGGPQLIVFDKEQAVVIGTENVPAAGTTPELSTGEWDRYYQSLDTDNPLPRPDDAAIERAFAKMRVKYSEDQPRDDNGRFASGGGGSSTTDKSTGGNDMFREAVGGRGYISSTPGSTAAREMKAANVSARAADLIAAAQDNPKLAEQLANWAPGNGYAGLEHEVYMDMTHAGVGSVMPDDPVSQGAHFYAAVLQDTWAQSASDTTKESLALQSAVAEKFGLDRYASGLFTPVPLNADGTTLNLASVPTEQQDGVYATMLADGYLSGSDNNSGIGRDQVVSAFVDSMYNATQQYLSDRGITQVEVARGVTGDAVVVPSADTPYSATLGTAADGHTQGETVPVTLNPASSFSTDAAVAARFGGGGNVFVATVPAENVLSVPMTGTGCLNEREVTVIGQPLEVQAYTGGFVRSAYSDAFSTMQDSLATMKPGQTDYTPAQYEFSHDPYSYPFSPSDLRLSELAAAQASPRSSDNEALATVLAPLFEKSVVKVRVKYSDDEERDDHGRWTSGGDSGTADTRPGTTDAGFAGNTALGQVVAAAGDKVPFTGAVRLRNEGLKQANVIATAKGMVAQASRDPQLASQLQAAGERVLALPVNPEPTVTHNGGMTTTFTPMDQYTVMHDRLGFSSPDGVDPKEVGARYIADVLQSTWAASSSNSKPESVALQMAVAEKFGVPLDVVSQREASFGRPVAWTGDELNKTLAQFGMDPAFKATEGYNQHDLAEKLAGSPATQAYVAETYGRTQDALKAAGITEVSLYRGMTWMSADSVPAVYRDVFQGSAPKEQTVNMAPLSSWSASPRTATDEFARRGVGGVTLTSTVDASRIFSFPSTGPGCLGEQEVVLVGGPMEAKVSTVESSWGTVDWSNLDLKETA